MALTHITSRSTGRRTRLSRGLQGQPARQPLAPVSSTYKDFPTEQVLSVVSGLSISCSFSARHCS